MKIGNFLLVVDAEFGVHDGGGSFGRLVSLLGTEGL